MELLKLRLTLILSCRPLARRPSRRNPASGFPTPGASEPFFPRKIGWLPSYLSDALRRTVSEFDSQLTLQRARRSARGRAEAFNLRFGAVERRQALLHVAQPSEVFLARLGPERTLCLFEFPM